MRKRSRLLIILPVMLLLSVFPVGAESFRVTVQGDNESYVSLFTAVLSSFPSASSAKALSLRRERADKEEKKAEMKMMTEKSQSESFTSAAEKKDEEYTLLDIETVSADLSPYSEFLASSDEEAYLYLRNAYSLDGIFCISSEKDGDVYLVTVLFNGEKIHRAWYNSATAESEENVLHTLLASLLLGDGYHLYRLDLTPSDATLLVDGTLHDGEADYIVLSEGEHTFALSGYGYKSGEYTLLLGGESDTISIALEEEERFPLLVTTYPYSASLYYNGVMKTGRYLSSALTPYVITLESEGFQSYSYQERRKDGHITLEMAPSWTEDGNLLEEKKSSFYSSLFYVLVSFGGYAASESISNYYSETAGRAVRVVFTGATILSLVNLIQNAVDYYNTASTGL